MAWRDRLAAALAHDANAPRAVISPHANCAKSANCSAEGRGRRQLAQTAPLAEGYFRQNGAPQSPKDGDDGALAPRVTEAELPRYPPAGPPTEGMIEALALSLAAYLGHRTPSEPAMGGFRWDTRRRLRLPEDDPQRMLLADAWRHRGGADG